MTVFYIACALALVSLISGILVLLRSGNRIENRIFFLVSIFSAVWSIVFASIELPDSLSTVILLNKLAYFFGLLALLTGTAFTYYFPIKKSVNSLLIYVVFVSPLLALSFTEAVAGTVVVDSSGQYIFEQGSLTSLYLMAFITGVALIILNGTKKTKKVDKNIRTQQLFIMYAYSASLILGIFLAVILPGIIPQTELDNLAPASLTIMVVLVSVAIIKHKLFDFKSVLVRSFVYLVSTAIFIFIYAASLLLLKRLLFPDQRLTTSQLVANVIVMVILLSFYEKLKIKFNKITNKIFYRDAYNPQELISRLNKTLVTNVNLDELLTKSALIIQEEMKVSFCTFYIRDTSYFKARVLGAHRNLPEYDNIEEIQELASKTHSKIFTTELMSEDDNDKKLSKTLKSNDVEVMARLTNTLDFEVKGIGYIFLGSKKSGSQYSGQDLKILEIIANELVIAIENVLRFEEIEQFNVTLQKKIDDATKELKQSNEKLRALDEAKDEFVSMASHQLRTPLTSIKGYISMVLEGDAGKINDTQKQMLGQAFFSSQRMVYLISDLLNVSRLKTGKFIIEKKPVYLPDVIESEIDQLYEGANAKNLTLSFTKPKEFSTLSLDEMKLRQVIMNFTDNAIYYTPSGGKITIELKETAKTVEFTVKDSGIGVPKEQQHKLFTKFYRADNARKARPDGTGLGLFMAKKVIIAQGGAMIFESKENKGSTFGFSFPKDKLLVSETAQKSSK